MNGFLVDLKIYMFSLFSLSSSRSVYRAHAFFWLFVSVHRVPSWYRYDVCIFFFLIFLLSFLVLLLVDNLLSILFLVLFVFYLLDCLLFLLVLILVLLLLL